MKKLITLMLVLGFMLVPLGKIYADDPPDPDKEARDKCVSAAPLNPINTLLCWGEYAIEKIASIL